MDELNGPNAGQDEMENSTSAMEKKTSALQEDMKNKSQAKIKNDVCY
jgi:hypothetical protein